ncbi:MAG: DUF4417 domain-containing protein [Oscillospiraceae bacterium]|nr:DUF4417 domain-containing protein [Oscillospiraceae bacterium]
MRKKKNLRKLLNLGILDYTNLTPKYGDLDMPYIRCKKVPDIDYLATYSQPSTYFHSNGTCVTFFEYDVFFDGLYGLWNGIYYGVKEIQEYYLERFQGVKYFIAPDYSKCGDVSEAENYYRQFRSRIVSIWLAINLDAIVIPLVSCANYIGMKYMLDGMEDCTVVAFNAKGPMGDPVQLEILIQSIEYTVDRLENLKVIIVYASSPDKEKVREIFRYAIEAGIEVQIPDNMLQTRNRLIGGDSNGSN